MENLKLDIDIINKYEAIKSPFYTTYPTGGEWTSQFNSERYTQALRDSCAGRKKVSLALYIHIPFCQKLCFFCFCYTKITSDRVRINRFTHYLCKEIDQLREFFEKNGVTPDVRQIQLGGGTPTYLTKPEFDMMIDRLATFVDIKNLDEFAMEIDPRTIVKDDLHYYYDKGINRISMGIQDFDPAVQKAINRIQPFEMCEKLLEQDVRRCSVNFDLIYGLPHQTRETFRNTVELAKKLGPDRFSIYNYDHTPDLHKHQRLMKKEDLAILHEKMLMFKDSVENLLESGYEWVGIDHFAKKDDRLAEAVRTRMLGRTLNGYSTFRDFDLELGLGPSSIGTFDRYYSQNIKDLDEYYKHVDAGKFSVFRGWELNEDDLLRREVIMTIILTSALSYQEIEEKHGIKFKEYFAKELQLLPSLADDGIIDLDDHGLSVTFTGRVFVYHVAKVFDKYLRGEGKVYVRTHDAIRFEEEKAKVNMLTGI